MGDSSGREWRKDRTVMHAMLAAVNATFTGEILTPEHWAMQAIAGADTALAGAGCGRFL